MGKIRIFHNLRMIHLLTQKLHRIFRPRWLSGGVASLSFDDLCQSAYLQAFPLLEKYGFKATWFVACDSVGTTDPNSCCKKYMTWDEINAVALQNHEIGSHSLSHPRLSTLAGNQKLLLQELQDSKKQIESMTSQKVDSFAYPFSDKGDAHGNVITLTGKIYKYCRCGDRDLNHWPFRLNALFAWPLYEKFYDIEHTKNIIDSCINNDAWLIFYTHDIEEKPSDFGCSPKYFENVLKYLTESRVTVKPIGRVNNQG